MSPLGPIVLCLAFWPTPADDRVVEPSALARDPGLVGKELVVDDRVRYFQAHKGPRGAQVYDELILKRTDVVFKIPPDLRPEHPPRQPSARVTGTLRSDGRQLTFEVSKLEMKPNDLDRLDQEVKRLDPGDGAGRSTWAAWAERRARDFKDSALADRAREVEAEAIRIEAERPGADDLALAGRARARGLDDAASALALRALRVRLDRSKTADELAKLAAEIEAQFPRSTKPGRRPGIDGLEARVRTNPIGAYAEATGPERAALERDLLGDLLERRFALRMAEAPGEALALAAEAAERLPDRPEVAEGLRKVGLDASEKSATAMRLSEVEALARTFREAGQPDRARALMRTWLADQRSRLNPSDSDGQVLLAGQYVALVDDRATAGDLLRDALRADPDLKAATDAFRRMGFRKSPETGEWFDPTTARAEAAAPSPAVEPPAERRGQGDSLRGLGLDQARRQLGGKPDRIARESSQDATIELWIYQQSKGKRVVVVRRPGDRSRPTVVGDYFVP